MNNCGGPCPAPKVPQKHVSLHPILMFIGPSSFIFLQFFGPEICKKREDAGWNRREIQSKGMEARSERNTEVGVCPARQIRKCFRTCTAASGLLSDFRQGLKTIWLCAKNAPRKDVLCSPPLPQAPIKTQSKRKYILIRKHWKQKLITHGSHCSTKVQKTKPGSKVATALELLGVLI